MSCIDAITGASLWDAKGTDPGSHYCPTPSIVGDNLAVYWRGKLSAIHLTPVGPDVLWQAAFFDEYSSPIIERQRVYAMGCQHADRRLTLTCYDWADGKIVWDLSVPNPEYSSPVLADGKLILLCNKGERLWLVDSQTGKRLADTEVGAKVWTSPAIVNGRLYLRLADDSLACYDLSASANE